MKSSSTQNIIEPFDLCNKAVLSCTRIWPARSPINASLRFHRAEAMGSANPTDHTTAICTLAGSLTPSRLSVTGCPPLASLPKSISGVLNGSACTEMP
jgi:hypothetical protein